MYRSRYPYPHTLLTGYDTFDCLDDNEIYLSSRPSSSCLRLLISLIRLSDHYMRKHSGILVHLVHRGPHTTFALRYRGRALRRLIEGSVYFALRR
jgi:hypothetical protein